MLQLEFSFESTKLNLDRKTFRFIAKTELSIFELQTL